MSPMPSAHMAAEIDRLMQEAAACYSRNDIASTEQRCRQVLAWSADFPQALHLLGLCRRNQGALSAAVELISRAARLRTGDARLLFDLGCAYAAVGHWQAGIRAYLQAIALQPDHAASHLNLGALYEQVGEPDQAERAYLRALDLETGLAAAAGSLAALCEAGNRLEDAERWVAVALQGDGNDPVANLTRAQLDFRAGQYRQSASRLTTLLERPLSPHNRSLAFAGLGGAWEKLGEYDQAFTAFVAAKEALGADGDIQPGPGFYTLETVNRVARHQDRLMAARVWASGVGEPAPVFLIGFPRSGTTLLDQILSSHPRLCVLEEKESLTDTLQDFVTTDNGITHLGTLDPAALGHYRQQYWQRVVAVQPEARNGRTLVDKLPLNTIFMPVIGRLFPNARYLFAVRDPRDVVLSCFTRAFGLNEAMRNFLTLADTACYYAAVMEIGIASAQRLGKSVHFIRYEALVDDVELAARGLCTFLGLGWDDTMLRFQETARRRRINTPSYHQVVQPIYQSARQRWRHYEYPLREVIPRLQPFVEYFGYGGAVDR